MKNQCSPDIDLGQILDPWIVVEQLHGIARKLYSEHRLTGDEMRNMAQTLESLSEQIFTDDIDDRGVKKASKE